jgi:hypothetical protein
VATRRLLGGLLVGVAALALAPGTAFADPPGPTDYLSRVTAISPAVPGLSARIIGGDSFLELTKPAGTEVTVTGYQGEPYLRFGVDGSISENLRSPTRALNTTRFGSAPVPADADASAPPEWRVVAHGLTYAWHDHRTHWMNAAHPIGRRPGDQVLEAVVPLDVAGTAVAITVTSTWEPAPSRLPTVLGGLLGVLIGAGIALAAARDRRVLGLAALAAVTAAALAVGAWQTWSVPAATGPPRTAWALPLSAVVVLGAGLVAGRRWTAFTGHGVRLLAGAQLLVWSWLRRDGLVRAVLPTDAPFWLDRAVTTGVGAAALVVVAGAAAQVVTLLRPRVQPAPG